MGIPYRILRSVLFRFDSERTHDCALDLARRASRRRWLRSLLSWAFAHRDLSLSTRVLGIDFDTPLGLAAGFDKDAVAVPTLAALGFGFVEVGSVTPWPGEGNPRPRMFRLPDDRALVNRLGLPSAGPTRVASNLGRVYPGLPVGVNVARAGRAFEEDPARALSEVADAATLLAPLAAYLTINASCPNTADGRALEDAGPLRELLAELRRRLQGPRPILIKLSPDLDNEGLEGLAQAAIEAGAAGIVCGNTSKQRQGLSTRASRVVAIGDGGLSGHPLLAGTKRRIARLRRALGPAPALVACGGISTGRDLYELVRLGADLGQIYSALVYRGPGAPGRIAAEFAAELRRVGARSTAAVRDLDL